MNRRAFTLIEVLVATAILALVVVLLASMANQVGRMWLDVNANNERRASARVLLNFMARDLQAASQPLPLPASKKVPANLQLLGSLSANSSNSTSIPAEFLRPHALFWQAPIAQNTSKGDIAVTGYFIRWDTSIPGQARPMLCRLFSDAADEDNFLVYQRSGDQAVDWISILPTVASVTAPEYKGWLSDNVIALWVRFLDEAGLPITQNAAGDTLNGGYGFDSRQGYRTAAGIVRAAPALPPCVEIALVTVDARTASKISQPILPQATSPSDFHKDENTPGSVRHFVDQLPPEIKKGARIFSTRIFLPSSL